MARPVILSVDDDPQVLSAIERDLNRHYKREYRVVKASSPEEALDAARQLKQRGTAVALFLVDQRMPGMTGTRLLRLGSRRGIGASWSRRASNVFSYPRGWRGRCRRLNDADGYQSGYLGPSRTSR